MNDIEITEFDTIERKENKEQLNNEKKQKKLVSPRLIF